jgi:hypothetical protein
VAVKITIPMALEKKLREIAEDTDPGNPFPTLARKLVARIDDARKGVEKKGNIAPIEVVNILRAAAPGGVLPLPPKPGPLMAFIKARVLFLGLEAEDVEKAAKRAAKEWRKPISIEWFIKRIQELLTDPVEGDPNGVTRTEPVVVTGREG